MKIYTLILGICFWVTQTALFAQSNLKQHHAFFLHADSLRAEWLSANGLVAYLRPLPSQLKEDFLVLPFEVDNKATYMGLKQKCDSAGIDNLPAFLQYKMAFLYDVAINKVRIQLEGSDVMVQIGTSEELYDKKIIESIYPKMGQSSGLAMEYGPLNHLSVSAQIPLKKSISTDIETEAMKKKLLKSLDTWFHKQNKSWFKKSMLEPIANYDRYEMLLRVSNIKNVVLDMGYFEVLQIKLKFEGIYSSSSIRIEVDGKYGAGILWTPYENDYHSMDPQYLPYLNVFVEKLKTKIAETLSK